ncbi:hypothetical protein LOAG_12193 [Loa loa]|uniref:Sex-determining region Y protein n=1 Tax=Loa loa TaxID=7209 RepID=A0A1S0TLN3_LOALO|nr:hypothetical protein LOAG_12193 [Loa loa]EFO16314.2 hypothetical protein LOAG_12193 [Loa loa]
MIVSPGIPFTVKRSIDEDHRNEIKEMNEYDVQKRIKRPMNAFMVWSQMRRAQIASTDVKMHNSQISKELGAEWREMSAEEKAPYVKRAKELREELMRRHPNYVYRPKRRSHGTTKNLLSKSCTILPTTTGPSMQPSSFQQRSHSLSSIPTAHDIRRFFLARVMQEQQNNMLLAAYRNQLLAAAATTTTPLKDSANMDLVDQEKLQSTMGNNITTGNNTASSVSMATAEQFNPISSLSMLQSSYNPITPLLGSQFNPFLFS